MYYGGAFWGYCGANYITEAPFGGTGAQIILLRRVLEASGALIMLLRRHLEGYWGANDITEATLGATGAQIILLGRLLEVLGRKLYCRGTFWWLLRR